MSWPIEYQKLRKDSDRRGERADCAVIAVAVTAGLTYNQAWKLLREFGREPRSRTPRIVTALALSSLGFYARAIQPIAKTVRSLERKLDERTYLVFTRGHVLAATEGKVVDYTAGRLIRVNEMYEVRRK